MKKIRMFLTRLGLVLGQDDEKDGVIVLKQPLIMQIVENGQANFSPVLPSGPEWMSIASSDYEFECNEGYTKAYEEGRVNIYSGIVSPTAQERAQILTK